MAAPPGCEIHQSSSSADRPQQPDLLVQITVRYDQSRANPFASTATNLCSPDAASEDVDAFLAYPLCDLVHHHFATQNLKWKQLLVSFFYQSAGIVSAMAGERPRLQDPMARDNNIQLRKLSGSGAGYEHDTAKKTPAYGDEGIEVDSDVWGDTPTDQRDMLRMGKKQEFKRNFSFLSALAFVSVYMATWEFVLVSLSVGFSNGGFAGLFWCFVTTVLAYSTVVASLAEMASMAPTAGGQYHWTSEFAPPRYQRILSYASGWMSTLGWLASVASSTFVVTTQIEAMINVTMSDYAFQPWQYFLIMLGFTLITIVFNTWGAPALPSLEVACLVGHLLGFFIVLIPLWILCPKNSAAEVFTDFQDNSGYGNMGTAYLISQVYVMYCNLGSDSIVHISEEVEDASLVVPRAMWFSYVGNVVLGLIMLITMLFCIGPLDDVLESDVPYLVLFNNTGSSGLSIFLNVVLFLAIYAGNITALATCAREVFAFARDKGLPFPKIVGRMDPKWNIPFNAVYITSVGVVLLSLINLGSTLAFNIIVSLSLLGLLSTYLISIGCVLLKRIKGEPLPPARWSLGRFGIAVNAFAFLYCAFIIIFSCFPTNLPVDLGTANWAPLVWVGVMIMSVVFYLVYGKRHYTAPVEFVEGKRAEGVGLQSS